MVLRCVERPRGRAGGEAQSAIRDLHILWLRRKIPSLDASREGAVDPGRLIGMFVGVRIDGITPPVVG